MLQIDTIFLMKSQSTLLKWNAENKINTALYIFDYLVGGRKYSNNMEIMSLWTRRQVFKVPGISS